jgi:hypothetical protein
MRTGGNVTSNIVLVDFENVQPKDVSLLNGSRFKVKVFLGSQQGKIPIEMARALQALGSGAEYIQIAGHGRNAVDFHIAYYIGRLAAQDPEAHFFVISRDTGFDPLIKHLKAQGIPCARSRSIAEMPLVKEAPAESTSDKFDVLVGNLTKRRAARPRTLKTLRSTIRALFGSQIVEDEIDGLVQQLTKRGLIKVADGKVQYELS